MSTGVNSFPQLKMWMIARLPDGQKVSEMLLLANLSSICLSKLRNAFCLGRHLRYFYQCCLLYLLWLQCAICFTCYDCNVPQVQVSEVFQVQHLSGLLLPWPSGQESPSQASCAGVLLAGEFTTQSRISACWLVTPCSWLVGWSHSVPDLLVSHTLFLTCWLVTPCPWLVA